MNFVDNLLNKITMYRLVLYVLLVWAAVGLIYSFFGIFPFNLGVYIFSFAFILVTAYFSNIAVAKIYKVPTNIESSLISGLILFLIMSPPKRLEDIIFVFCISIFTSLSKFIIAINRKHIFNPVAISVLLGSLIFKIFPSWWIGSASMLPFIAVGGFLIIKKIRRWDLILGFMIVVLLTISPLRWGNVLKDTTLIFFAAIMLIEPQTTPPTRLLRIIYGAIIGFLFYNQTPETVLVIGNIFSYIVSPKYKLLLYLKDKIQLTPDTYDFIFDIPKPIKFTPGQYMEFTFDHPNPDSRGNRRYLSLASSPTEKDIRLGIKFGNPPSSFKKNFLNLTSKQKIVASQLIGDFTLPRDINKKLVFIAGGIGITPFRSILKYLVDTGEKRDIVLIYTAKTADEFVYRDVISEAQDKLGMKVIYNDSEVHGHLSAEILSKEIPDYKDRTFYISGSHGVVTAFENIVTELKVPKNQIITDYFPGFA